MLNPKVDYIKPPFDLAIFNRDILQRLRSQNYLDVVTEDEVLGILKRNRLEVPDEFEPKIIGRMGKVTECNNVAYMRIVSFELDRESGYGIPFLAHRNKVTYRAVLELTIVDSQTATAKYYEKIVGRSSIGRGVQVFRFRWMIRTFFSISGRKKIWHATLCRICQKGRWRQPLWVSIRVWRKNLSAIGTMKCI